MAVWNGQWPRSVAVKAFNEQRAATRALEPVRGQAVPTRSAGAELDITPGLLDRRITRYGRRA